MSTVTLPCNGGTFISYQHPHDPQWSQYYAKTSAGLLGSNNEEAKLREAQSTISYGYIYIDYGGAVLEFQHNSAIENKKITRAVLTYRIAQTINNDPAPLKDWNWPESFVEIIAGYKSSLQMDQITLDNYKSNGTLSGTIINKLGDSFDSSLTSLVRNVDVTDIFKSQFTKENARFIISTGTNNSGTIPMNVGQSYKEGADAFLYIREYPENAKAYTREIYANESSITVTYENMPQSDPTPLYPCNISIMESDQITFSWQFNSETTQEQKSATIQYKSVTAESWETVTSTGNSTSCSVPVRLAQGSYQWRVLVTNTEDESSSYCEAQTFNIIGKPASPVINEPANKALTEITWQATGQEAIDLMFYDSDGKLIDHVTEATTNASYKPQLFLRGNYNIKIRIKNNTDLWSDFGQYGFTISGTAPNAGNLVVIPLETSVKLEWTAPEGANSVIVRRENGVETVLTETMTGNTYEDKTVKSGVLYEYILRTWTNGFTDTPSKQFICNYSGAILSTGDEELHLEVSDETFIPHSGEKERSHALDDFVGRDNPLLELGNAKRNRISKRFFVTAEELEKFFEITQDLKVYYRDNHKNAFMAAVTRQDYTNFNNSGYILQFELTRLAEEEVIFNV